METKRMNEILLYARMGRGMVSELNDMEEAAILVCGLHDRIKALEDELSLYKLPVKECNVNHKNEIVIDFQCTPEDVAQLKKNVQQHVKAPPG